MKKSKVSIAMATYNGEKYLQEQLDSFCRQMFLPFELVLCDDCSSGRTCEIIEYFKIIFFNTFKYKNKMIVGYLLGGVILCL